MNHVDYQDLAALDALGVLDGNEIVELHQHLSECAECQEVERDYQECASMLALSLNPITPPARARAQILRNVTALPSPAAEVVDIASRRPPWWLAAAAIFFLALFGWSELRIRALREELSQLTASQNAAMEQNRRLQSSNHLLSNQLGELSSPANRTISLAGQNVAPGAKAKVFLNEKDRSAILFFQDLPPNNPDKSYELWIVRANASKADPAGTFDVATDGSARLILRDLPLQTEIKALAVTLEPRGGVPVATGEKYLIGSL